MFKRIDSRTLSARLQAGERLHLLDVRQPWEHQQAALSDSQLIPLGQLSARVAELPAEVPIVVYCHHGIRSQTAAEILARQGFHDVYSLDGGIDAWSIEIDPSVPRY